MLVWADGAGFRSGGALHWQLFDANGQLTSGHGRETDTIPHDSVAAALARGDGTFLVIF